MSLHTDDELNAPDNPAAAARIGFTERRCRVGQRIRTLVEDCDSASELPIPIGTEGVIRILDGTIQWDNGCTSEWSRADVLRDTELVEDAPGLDVRYVNAYDVNQAYGGSEEGGWWYTVGSILASIPCLTDADVEDALQRLDTIYRPDYQGPRHRDLGSVLCEGVLQLRVEDHAGRDYPTERPHYE
jgi:hypothetical protein